MKLYYHKTSGGAEYLTDKSTFNTDGSKEGVFTGARYIVRIDGDITRDAELTVTSAARTASDADLLEALKRMVDWFSGTEPDNQYTKHMPDNLLEDLEAAKKAIAKATGGAK